MPELPDLEILADALDAGLAGRPLIKATTPQSLVLRGTPAELAAYEGQVLREVSRRGKILVLRFDRDQIVVNAMLTGRLGFAMPKSKAWPQTAAVLTFGPAVVHKGAISEDGDRARPIATWVGDADWLPARDAEVELRYRDATRMGKIYLLPAGITRPVAGWDEMGPDAADPALALDVWRARIAKHNGEVKNLLRNQTFVAGIGNAYSDEILWEARLAPFRTRASLAPAEIDALYDATRKVLPWAIDELRRLVPPRLEVEQRKFLNVHWKGGEPCPRCGTRLTEVKAGGFVTTWCRGCQR
ncbi:MAG: DNA-formamidopyrimidine glycosylase family protein [Candidatus Limnocylindrales bacterium]